MKSISRTFFTASISTGLALLLAACGRQERITGNSGSSSAAAKPAAVAKTAAPATPTPEMIAHGKELFVTCAACHGPNARGLPHLGKDLVASTFVAENSDAELVAFIKRGRDPSDPLNTTKVAMPPKGGNPVLTDKDLQDLAAYLHSINDPNAPPPEPAPATTSVATPSS